MWEEDHWEEPTGADDTHWYFNWTGSGQEEMKGTCWCNQIPGGAQVAMESIWLTEMSLCHY